jgi:rhodanese-related sulfurtransferase
MWPVFALLACGTPDAGPSSAVRTVDVTALHDAGKVPLIDVRTPGEYAAGHVPGAVNVPLDTLSAAAVGALVPPGGEVWVICEVGGRSAAASKQLAAWGLAPVNVDGGTRAWRAAGWPVE